jgi:amino acid transporter
MLTRFKRLVLGEPLSNQMAHEERLSKKKALAVLASDALSSTAYATEEILIPLTLALAMVPAALSWSIPISFAIVLLMAIVAASYRQSIQYYPNGGGAYIVSKTNLGQTVGLVAGAAMLIDYILTVAVSVAAGVANIASAFPYLQEHRIGVASVVVLVLMLINLRGVRESGTFFAIWTYGFIGSFIIMIIFGTAKLLSGHAPQPEFPVAHAELSAVPVILLMRAFASGCTAMTGIETVANGLQVFRPPAVRNARITLVWMIAILAALFIGITALTHYYGVTPKEGETVVSMLARAIFGTNVFYYIVTGSTAIILFLAANAAYAGFPRLASLLAKDRFLPRQLASLGDRLVFSNGILGLSVGAVSLIVFFGGDTHSLIPLYAVGVFLAFTLSQAGMVKHHFFEREPGWKTAIVINILGCITTAIVLSIIAWTKFAHGAWMIVVTIPIVVFVFTRVHSHYLAVGRELSLVGLTPPRSLDPIKHTVIVPVSGIHRGVLDALRYALSISDDVRAAYVELDAETTERMQEEWRKWAHEVPFVVLKSPYRSVIRPLLEYIDDVEQTTHRDMITVIIPEFVTAKWWHQILHNQTAFLIRAALLFRRGKVVTSVRYHLRAT